MKGLNHQLDNYIYCIYLCLREIAESPVNPRNWGWGKKRRGRSLSAEKRENTISTSGLARITKDEANSLLVRRRRASSACFRQLPQCPLFNYPTESNFLLELGFCYFANGKFTKFKSSSSSNICQFFNSIYINPNALIFKSCRSNCRKSKIFCCVLYDLSLHLHYVCTR